MDSVPGRDDGRRQGRILHKELSYRIVGCAQKVHRTLGPGFPESVYHKAMCYELMDAGLAFESEKSAEVFYGGSLCGEFRMDILVDNTIVLELKALAKLTDEHIAQALSYLKATALRLAILINFGAVSLETKRIAL